MLFGFNRGAYPVGGSYHTVCPYAYSFGNPYKVVHGASHRTIYDLSDWDNSFTVIPTGNNGIPASRHYCDQTDLYIGQDYHHDYFSEEIIRKRAWFTMKFLPK